MTSRAVAVLALALLTSGCEARRVAPAISSIEPQPNVRERDLTVVPASEVEWQQLNPARGDASPMAATLWGDRNGQEPTGFLFKAVDGFRSPPHAHNVSYRGVVLGGRVHNDDPGAAVLWMPKGSFWTQPKGEVHITAAKGDDVLAYIEIDEGPYLVLPTDEAFETQAKPINVHESNLVWVAPRVGAPSEDDSPELAFLWATEGDSRLEGALLRLPVQSSANLRSVGNGLRGVVVQGQPRLVPRPGAAIDLAPGSYFHAKGDSIVRLSCPGAVACIAYLRAEGRLELAGFSEDQPGQ